MGADRSAELDQAPEDAVYCARHPDVETYLRCGRCNTPICPRCLVQSPVGARCPDCAHSVRIPTLEVGASFVARGAGAALVAGAVCGFIWAMIIRELFVFGLFATLGFGLAMGWAISEAISASTNRKRGTSLQVIAIVGAIVAYLVRNVVLVEALIIRGDELGYLAAGVAAFFGASRLKFF